MHTKPTRTDTSSVIQQRLAALTRQIATRVVSTKSLKMPPKSPASTQHYNDWPNTQGFDTKYEERKPIQLEVEGTIPSYAAGVLFRTGLGPREFDTDKGTTHKVNHWFDQFSQVHRFQINAPKAATDSVTVTYNSRITCDDVIAQIKKDGKRNIITFGAKYDPCTSFFQKMQSAFSSAAPKSPSDVNIGVTITPNFPGLTQTGEKKNNGFSNKTIETICNKTDTSGLQLLDPETLEPRGVCSQKTLHPDLKGVMSGAHAKFDPITGDVYNYNLDLGRQGTYRVFTVSASTGKTSILATIQHASAYLHSIFLTEHYVVLCVWNSNYKAGGAAILWTQNLADAMTYDTSRPATWFVVDRKIGGKGHVATYESDAFFAFHSVNAYEDPSKTTPGGFDIIADIPVYPSLECITRFYIDNMLSTSSTAERWRDPKNKSAIPVLRRYRLLNISEATRTKPAKAIQEFEAATEITPELPTINPAYATKKHRYVYGIVDSGKSAALSDSLVRYDVVDHNTKIWSVHGHTAGEAIFVADPNSDEEDAGVLMTVVLDGFEGKSYLLVLDPKTMQEVGRAKVPGVVGFGFHGTYVSGSRVDNWGA